MMLTIWVTMLLKQTWFSAGRGSNSGPNEANRSAASHQSRWLRLQNPKQLLSDVFQHESFDTPDTPNTWAPDLGGFIALKPRQGDNLNINVSTCGYLNGDASKPRTADSGFDCRVDTKNAIWGFCPTTILAVSNCGLVGGCVDAHACDSGCGISGDPTVTTFTWFVNPFAPGLAIFFPSPTSALVYLIASIQIALSG